MLVFGSVLSIILGPDSDISGTSHYHRENGGTLGMVPLIINPLYSGHLLGPISPVKGSNRGVKQLGQLPSQGAPTIFPMKLATSIDLFLKGQLFNIVQLMVYKWVVWGPVVWDSNRGTPLQ